MDLAVLIPVWNGEQTIAAQLAALDAQEWQGAWEVVVVDNGSTDRTGEIVAEYVARRPERYRVIAADRAHNLSYVRNAGVASVRARSVAFCDADDVVGRGWVAAIGEALRQEEFVVSALEYQRLNEPAAARSSTFQSKNVETMFGLPVASGAGFGIRRSLWCEAGGNDETWDATGEDFEFSMRLARDTGVVPVFVEGAIYHYRLRSNARAVFRQYRRWGRSHPRLAASFGSSNLHGNVPLRTDVIEVALLLVKFPFHLRASKRVAYARSFGRRLGRIEGRIRSPVGQGQT